MIYEPAEDSYLMQEQVKHFAKGNVLEIGTGSGILAEEAARHADHVLAVDINPFAIDKLNEKEHTKIEFRVSNLFSNIKSNEKFDLIIFNPPYLPKDKREDNESARATTGGEKGWETIAEFLKKAGKHLADGGKILLLFSSLTGKEKIDELISANGFSFLEIARQKISFEELYVYILN